MRHMIFILTFIHVSPIISNEQRGGGGGGALPDFIFCSFSSRVTLLIKVEDVMPNGNNGDAYFTYAGA